jgi:hypothetical protein
MLEETAEADEEGAEEVVCLGDDGTEDEQYHLCLMNLWSLTV